MYSYNSLLNSDSDDAYNYGNVQKDYIRSKTIKMLKTKSTARKKSRTSNKLAAISVKNRNNTNKKFVKSNKSSCLRSMPKRVATSNKKITRKNSLVSSKKSIFYSKTRILPNKIPKNKIRQNIINRARWSMDCKPYPPRKTSMYIFKAKKKN